MIHIHHKNEDYLNKIYNFKFSEFTIDYVLNNLKDRYRWPYTYFKTFCPSIEIIDVCEQQIIKNTNFFDNDGYVNSEKIISLYEEGYTLILSKCQFLSKELSQFHELISIQFGIKQIQMNLYMSKGSKTTSFPPHYHNYDVLVKNVCGISEWIFGEKNIILKDGDIINIPKYTLHGVTKIHLPKLSITCNLN